MAERKYLPVLIETITGSTSHISMRQIAMRCDVHPEIIDRFVRLGLIDPVVRDEVEGECLFSKEAAPLVRKIMRLRNELGINYSGVGVVLELLSRIELLEARIHKLESP